MDTPSKRKFFLKDQAWESKVAFIMQPLTSYRTHPKCQTIRSLTIFGAHFYLVKDRSIWDMQQLDDLTSKLGTIYSSEFLSPTIAIARV